MRCCLYACILIAVSLASVAEAQSRPPWIMKALSIPPKFTADPSHDADGVHAIFYDGVPWKGKPTRVFAYYALPKLPAGQRAPAMVLVHGGGGSAFIPWVKLWRDRGYAAIAMDTCGCISSGGYANHPRHDAGGPPGWGGFDQIDEPITDQWTFHAVADVILAHSLIRSMPEVDPKRVGLTGISWGGYLTCIVAGVDNRFKFAAPVYGCGFLGEDSVWVPTFHGMGTEKSKKWLELWDPSVYLSDAKMPMLWVDGTNDFAYPPDSLQKSYRLPNSPRTICMRVRMPHGHGGPGENPEEIHATANSIIGNGLPLAVITKAGTDGGKAFVEYRSKTPIVHAEFNYTLDTGEWQKRNWLTVDAFLVGHVRASAAIPAGVKAWYINLIDGRGLVVSSEHMEP